MVKTDAQLLAIADRKKTTPEICKRYAANYRARAEARGKDARMWAGMAAECDRMARLLQERR